MIPEVHVTDVHVQELLNRLAEAEETLRAIRHGEVDGLVVQTPHGERVFTLKGAEQPYRIMVEAMEEGAATLSADGVILYCNPRFAAMLHAPHEHVHGAMITDFLAPGSHAEFSRLLAGCRHESMRGEVELQAADAARVPVSLACSVLPASEVESICLVATDLTARKAAEAEILLLNQELEARVEARTAELEEANAALRKEITERKQAEEELAQARTEAERRAHELATFMDTVPTGVMITRDREGMHISGNRMAHELLRVPLEESNISKSAPDPVNVRTYRPQRDGVDLSPEELPIQQAARGCEIRDWECDIAFDDGEVRHVCVNAVPLYDECGAPCGAIAAFLDDTERKWAEQERERLLAEVERRAAELDSIINSSTDAILLYDTDNYVVLMNPAAEELYGMSLADFQASTCTERRDLFRIETLDGHPYPPELAPNSLALRGEVVRGALAVMHCPNGRTVWTTASSAPVRTADGAIVGAVASITDISALHEMQEQQRTLLHLVSHDLRIPLAIVNGHTELVQERLGRQADDTPIADSLAAIGRGIRRMNTMIEDLTDLARLEGKQFQLHREPLALASCLQALLSQASSVLDIGRIHLDMPGDLPPVLADGDRLHRIVTNLLSNALKYSDPGTPVLVKASRQGDDVVVSVTDQGHGVASVDLPHLFERFYRAQGERRAEGIGLGLYITRLLVEAHGGCIWVDSEPGQGSTFHFSLPVA